MAQVLHLCAVGRDDAHVEPLLEDALATYLLEVVLQSQERQFGLGLVDAPVRLAHELLPKEWLSWALLAIRLFRLV